MDIHNRYLNFPTIDIKILQSLNDKLKDDTLVVPRQLMQSYITEITKETVNISKLEVYRMLLCYEYQQQHRNKQANEKYKIPDVDKTYVFTIQAMFPAHYLRSAAEMSVLHDIVILHTVLYCNIEWVKQDLKDFLRSYNAYATNSDTRTMYMKVSEYLLESLDLHWYRNDERCSEKELKEFASMYIEVVRSWMKTKNDSEWGVFASLFSKLASFYASEHVLHVLWDYIIFESHDSTLFTVLSMVIDTCLKPSNVTQLYIPYYYIVYNIFSNNFFWEILLDGLQSPMQQYRKQALYVVKRATDYFISNATLFLKWSKAELTPFICNKSNDSAQSVNSLRQKFFLVYEALEEKQYHLVAPALTHITSLVKACKKSCRCFNIAWLQCILQKILRHENNNVVKWSVSYICKLDSSMVFDSKFLDLFVSTLNNSFLYECQPNKGGLKIVEELSTFFKCIAKEETNLLNRFLKKVSKVAWGPIAIFNVVHALRTVSQEAGKYNEWQVAELNAIKSLVETNLNMHSHILRTASQIELLRAMPNFIRRIDDLELLANVLAAFPSGEGLVRGRFPWNVITEWLRETLRKEDAVTFVEKTCTKYSFERNLVPEVGPRTFALMVFLLHDASLVFSDRTCPAENALNNWLFSLNGIETRPYADICSCIDAAEFISHSLNFLAQRDTCQPSETRPDGASRLMSVYVHVTFKFLIKNMKRMTTGLTYDDYTRFTAILSSHVANVGLVMLEKYSSNYIEELQDESIRLLKDMQRHQSVQYLYGMYILYLSWNKSTSSRAGIFYMENIFNPQVTSVEASDEPVNLQGKIATEYNLLLSRLAHQYVSHTPVDTWIFTCTLLTHLSKYLELDEMETVSEVAKTLTVMLNNGAVRDQYDWGILQDVFYLFRRYILVSKKNNVSWTTIQNFTGVIVNNNFLRLEGAKELVTEFIDKLQQEGDTTTKFRRILLSKMEGLNMFDVMGFEKPLLNCFLHGFVLRRDERIENYVYLFITKYLGQYFPKHISVLDYNNNAAVRALATILLHKIASLPNLNCVKTMVLLIFEMWEKYKNKCHFNDSYVHKLKHRLMQILLILEPIMSKELVALTLNQLRDSILLESNQHSVRLMQEWLMIRILKRNSNLHNELWKFFTESIEKRPKCTVSVASIVYHVALVLSGASQKTFIRTALPYIAQCCLGQQFNMRLYNQFILIRLYELMKEMDDNDSISDYKGIYQAAIASLQQANSMKNSTKIQDDFYFSTSFHPINNYSLQTIYLELPRLTNVSCDEWIGPDVFEAFMFKENYKHPLQLYNINSFLSDTTTSMYLTKTPADYTESLANNVETHLEGLDDIQRKIDPSKLTVWLYNDHLGTIGETVYQQNSQLNEKSLIVVASLVSRPPNLGGITRTCEIFGVKSLVVENLDCVKDKEFQCLSVSAEKWINMLQVKPDELQQYLLEKKNEGWSLIGAEQTANSVNLLEAKFEKKTILVLGNEKDGIPANLIPLFDTCVEIPQAGVIRSLNVHVTAAICIWQYASQYTLK